MLKKIGLVTIVVSGMAGLANAADLPPVESDWVFTLAPYGWAIGVNGNATVGRLPPEVEFDVDFSQILNHLAAPPVMFVGEARNGRFSIGSDLIWAKLSDNVQTPRGFFARDVEGTLEIASLTGIGGYSLWYGDGGNLDVVAGARMWSVDIGLDIKGERGLLDDLLGGHSFGRGDTWVDPVVGLKGRANINENFYLAGWGLIGGFDVSDDKLMWDVMGTVGYDFNDLFSMTLGYRSMGLDYRRNDLAIDAEFSGPLIGFVFNF
ncbi:hypothetical protein G5V57_08870 [Nordella sp. HKS 07]|uniref:hypothetical protein n=1 Tax=Nordella sp. HKS 07 TaxID=2712222 RepID=UPI0013E1C88B|nr:hypothetical protein [Nordella sp. HKS 07]QIG47825.1 hypothetical protein G5V57_08870 [Nordella sp. HKS 07]